MLLNSSMIFQHYGKFMLLVLETTRPTPKSWGYYGRRSSFQAHLSFFFNIFAIPCFLCLGQKEKHVLIQAQNQHLYASSFHISKPHLSGLEMSANAVHLHATVLNAPSYHASSLCSLWANIVVRIWNLLLEEHVFIECEQLVSHCRWQCYSHRLLRESFRILSLLP